MEENNIFEKLNPEETTSREPQTFINEESDNINVEGHTGTWYVIDSEMIDGKNLFLLESEQYGDEAAAIIIDKAGNLVLDGVYNGFDDYREHMTSIDKEEGYISIDELDEVEENSFKDIAAIFDKNTGNYIEVIAEEVKDKVITDKDVEEITLYKILDELKSRKDIKSLTLDVHIDGKTESFKTSDKQGESISDAVEAIKLAVKDFKDIVIVYSREELEFLITQYREENGLEISAEKSESEAETKNYKDIKSEFIAQIKKNESMARCYIRISDEDYAKLGDILDENEIPHIAKQSDFKEGTNIIIPINKIDQLKDIISSKDIKCLQIVHGNVDWQDIKGTKNMCIGVSKEDFLKFQELNNNKFNYIAFENDKGFSVYMEKDCNIKIKTKTQTKENVKNESSKEKDTFKKTLANAKEEVKNIKKGEDIPDLTQNNSEKDSIVDKNVDKEDYDSKDNKKSLNQVKQSVEDAKNKDSLKDTQSEEKQDNSKNADKISHAIEKSKNEKER